MTNLPNEIINLILSYMEISPVCKLMRKSIDDYNDALDKMLERYTTKRKFNSYYFHVIVRYKIDQILKFHNPRTIYITYRRDDRYEVIEDELWMLDYYGGDFDISVLSNRQQKIPFRNMDFSTGYRATYRNSISI
jgi:hypothetical protein